MDWMHLFRITTMIVFLTTRPATGGWVSVTQPWSSTRQIVNSSIFEYTGPCKPQSSCRMVRIQTGHISQATQLKAFVVDGGRMNSSTPVRINSTKFIFQDEEKGKKARLEATNCFVTAEDLRQHGVEPDGEESRMLQELHFIYENCTGAASTTSAAVPTSINVSYSLYLPSNFSAKSQAIIGQFHGRPDPRIFFEPATKRLVRMTTARAYAICNSSRCKEGEVIGGEYDGWRYKQGGYPPLMFGYVPNEHDDPEVAGEGWWYVYGRSDNRVFIPKANCAFNAGKKYWPNKKICPSSSEKVNGIWRAPFSALPLGHWLDFEWHITWSAYSHEGGATLTNGSVTFRILDGGANSSAQHSVLTREVLADVTWTGPLGRHDDGRAPFFKFGFYDPSGDTEPIGPVMFRHFKQNTSVALAAATPAID